MTVVSRIFEKFHPLLQMRHFKFSSLIRCTANNIFGQSYAQKTIWLAFKQKFVNLCLAVF